MTVNYYLKCPVCGSVTRMRSPAGYVEKTPVRVHCGDCETLMTGEFIANSKTLSCHFEPINCPLSTTNFDISYYGEASGEMLVHKICALDTDVSFILPTPAIINMFDIEIEDRENYVDYVCYISDLSSNWDKHSILYQLFQNEKYDLIKSKYLDAAQEWKCDLSSDYEIQRFIHLEYLYDFNYLFGEKKFKSILSQINYEITHLDKRALNTFILDVLSNEKIKFVQQKMFKIMNSYISIALNLMPALSVNFYKKERQPNLEQYGMSTCSFYDIKNFYLDSFESLATCCDIIKCLDNIKYRGGYDEFGTKMNLDKFNNNTKNGNRVKELKEKEFFSEIFGVTDKSYELRNAIGHGDFDYNGLSQKISYKSNNQQQENDCCKYLVDVAIECIEQMKSSIVLELIMFELIREKCRTANEVFRIHPVFYKKVQGKNHCPCGSGKKYSKCCRMWNENNAKSIKNFKLPSKSNMRFSIDDLPNLIKKYNKEIEK